jgi:hypothetical protein
MADARDVEPCSAANAGQAPASKLRVWVRRGRPSPFGDMTSASHKHLVKALSAIALAIIVFASFWARRHMREHGRLLVFGGVGAVVALVYTSTRVVLRFTAPLCANCRGGQQWKITQVGDVEYSCPVCRAETRSTPRT